MTIGRRGYDTTGWKAPNRDTIIRNNNELRIRENEMNE